MRTRLDSAALGCNRVRSGMIVSLRSFSVYTAIRTIKTKVLADIETREMNDMSYIEKHFCLFKSFNRLFLNIH